ncbi:hypothetical protein BDZ91DRAFT_766463 [Kalaharituber pfeilii]|nr:hypothetical protein BDZ91DRAFT_766463 [Kalaharituber pfeilii]
MPQPKVNYLELIGEAPDQVISLVPFGVQGTTNLRNTSVSGNTQGMRLGNTNSSENSPTQELLADTQTVQTAITQDRPDMGAVQVSTYDILSNPQKRGRRKDTDILAIPRESLDPNKATDLKILKRKDAILAKQEAKRLKLCITEEKKVESLIEKATKVIDQYLKSLKSLVT